MGRKAETQLGFRCTPELAQQLRDLAEAEKVSVQRILEVAVTRFLDAQEGGHEPVLDEEKKKAVTSYLEALAHGDPDLVANMQSLIRSINRIARKRRPRDIARGRIA